MTTQRVITDDLDIVVLIVTYLDRSKIHLGRVNNILDVPKLPDESTEEFEFILCTWC